MLEAARAAEWDEAIRLATLLVQEMSDGKGEWIGDWAAADAANVQNILLNLREALDLMQHRYDDLRGLLDDVRNQQRLQASYGNG